jgi:hypothetical protein
MSIIVLTCVVESMACGVIPSIRSNCWCHFTLRVLLSIFLVFFMVNVLVSWMFKGLFLNLYGVFSLISLNIYYKWYHNSFLGTKWDTFFSFC